MAGHPPATADVQWVWVRGSADLPVAFHGLRTTLRALSAEAPDLVGERAARFPSEWERLFPSGRPDGPTPLQAVALSPSERRLHRESEQVYRTLRAASAVIGEVCAAGGLGVVVLDAGGWDLVSLRGLILVAERGRLDGRVPVRVGGWEADPPRAASARPSVRGQHLDVIRRRVAAEPPPRGAIAAEAHAHGPCSEGTDGQALRALCDEARPAAERLGAAVAALRSCFFSTNYEGGLLASEVGLDVLERYGGAPGPEELAAQLGSYDHALASPAMEVDADLIGDAAGLRAFLLKGAAVIRALVGDDERALDIFGKALASSEDPVQRAQLRMYRTLVLAKRLGRGDEAMAEGQAGLEEIDGRDDHAARREQGWLRNVLGLVRFQGRDLAGALEEERRALAAVGTLVDASATHLKINLISNVSVLQEAARRHADALKTWERFSEISDAWDDNFSKHHTYRRAGLLLAAGDAEAAEREYEEAYRTAGKLGDDYHQCVIANELGSLSLSQGRRDAAARRFEDGRAHARELGDPYWVAQSHTGVALAGDGDDRSASPELERAREAALATRVRAEEASALVEAIDAGDEGRLKGHLPSPRSKLNRPFTLINVP